MTSILETGHTLVEAIGQARDARQQEASNAVVAVVQMYSAIVADQRRELEVLRAQVRQMGDQLKGRASP